MAFAPKQVAWSVRSKGMTPASVLPNAAPFFGIDVPFMEHIGLKPLSLGVDGCRTLLAWQPALVNSRGDIHGGTLMSAFDFTLSAAARAHEPLRYGAVTIDMTTHFLEAARSDLTVMRPFAPGAAVDRLLRRRDRRPGRHGVAVARAVLSSCW